METLTMLIASVLCWKLHFFMYAWAHWSAYLVKVIQYLCKYLCNCRYWDYFFIFFTFITSPFFFFFRSSSSTTLSYEVNVIPRFNFPAIFLERIIRSDLPVNLQALACRAEKNFQGIQRITLTDNSSAGGALCEIDKLSLGEFKERFAGSNFGPLPPSSTDLNSNWGVFGKVCRLDRPCLVDEVHLRRFDGLLVTHPTYTIILSKLFSAVAKNMILGWRKMEAFIVVLLLASR